jgi:hypothetical protein
VTEPGLVSTSLEAELREQARQHGILVWLDKEGNYTRTFRRVVDRDNLAETRP